MPTYQYHCQKCDREFDQFQSIADTALKTCPKDRCQVKPWGKGKVKRVISAGAGLIFKGSGFYITDYRSDSYKEAAKKDAPAAPSGGGGSDGGKGSGKGDGGASGASTAAAPAAAPSKSAQGGKAGKSKN